MNNERLTKLWIWTIINYKDYEWSNITRDDNQLYTGNDITRLSIMNISVAREMTMIDQSRHQSPYDRPSGYRTIEIGFLPDDPGQSSRITAAQTIMDRPIREARQGIGLASFFLGPRVQSTCTCVRLVGQPVRKSSFPPKVTQTSKRLRSLPLPPPPATVDATPLASQARLKSTGRSPSNRPYPSLPNSNCRQDFSFRHS